MKHSEVTFLPVMLSINKPSVPYRLSLLRTNLFWLHNPDHEVLVVPFARYNCFNVLGVRHREQANTLNALQKGQNAAGV